VGEQKAAAFAALSVTWEVFAHTVLGLQGVSGLMAFVVQRKRSDGSVGYQMRWRQGGRWQSDIFDTERKAGPGAAQDVGDHRVIGDQPGRNDRIHRFRSSAESHDRVSHGGQRQKVHAEPIQMVPALFVVWALLCGLHRRRLRLVLARR
jgi:hypothetical protein